MLQGSATVAGRWLDRVTGLTGAWANIAMMQTPAGSGQLELTRFYSPTFADTPVPGPANAPGIRHVAFAVRNIDTVAAGLLNRGAELVGELEQYEDSYKLCYVRGPEGVIIELAEQIAG